MVRIWTDDIDGGDAVETLTFTYRGDVYEVDVSLKNLDRYEELMNDFISAARKLGPAPPVITPTATPVALRPVQAALPSAPVSAPPVPAPASAPAAADPVVIEHVAAVTVPPAPADPAPAPAPTAAPVPEPAAQPVPEFAAGGRPEPAEAAPPKPFANLTFEDQPAGQELLAALGAITPGRNDTSGANTNGAVRSVRIAQSAKNAKKGKFPRPPHIERDLARTIRDWAKEQPEFANAPTNGKIPQAMWDGFCEAHATGPKS